MRHKRKWSRYARLLKFLTLLFEIELPPFWCRQSPCAYFEKNWNGVTRHPPHPLFNPVYPWPSLLCYVGGSYNTLQPKMSYWSLLYLPRFDDKILAYSWWSHWYGQGGSRLKRSCLMSCISCLVSHVLCPAKAQSRPILKIPSRSRPVPSRPAG